MRVLALVLAAPAFAVSCGGGNGGGADYGGTLEANVPPLAEAFDATVEPCLAADLPECERLLGEADRAAGELLESLEGTDAPEELAGEDEQLQGGVAALREALQHGVAAAGSGSDDELPPVRTEIHDATVDVNNALGKIDEQLGLDLPTVSSKAPK